MTPDGAAHLGDELSALLDGELAAPRVEAARRHLAGCPACARELARVGQARAWVRGLPTVEPPRGFFEGIVGGRFAAVPLRHRRRALVSVAACVAAAGVVLTLTPPEESPTSPPVGRLVEAHATGGGTAEPLTQLVPVGVPVSFGR